MDFSFFSEGIMFDNVALVLESSFVFYYYSKEQSMLSQFGMGLKLLLTVWIVDQTQSQTNLLCNGDFQSYTLSNIGSDSQGSPNNWGEIFNDACWYASNRVSFEVKTNKPPLAVPTKVADTIFWGNYGICQRVNLVSSYAYQVKFQVISDEAIQSCSVSLKIDGVEKMSRSYSTSPTVFSQTLNYTATSTASCQFCFHGSVNSYNLGYFLPGLYFGVMFDNISLVQLTPNPSIANSTNTTSNTTNTTANTTANITNNVIANTTVNTTNSTNKSDTINGPNSTKSYSKDSVLPGGVSPDNQPTIIYVDFLLRDKSDLKYNVLESNLSLIIFHLISVDFIQSWRVSIDGEQIKFLASRNASGFLQITFQSITVLYDRQSLNKMSIAVPQQFYQLSSLYRFILSIDGHEMKYSLSSTNNSLQALLPLTMAISIKIKQVYVLMSTFGCAYFVLNMIAFYNMMLLYYFLFVKALPDFARSFIYNMAYIFLKGGSLQGLLNKLKWFRDNVRIDFSTLSIKEKVQQAVSDKDWFGSFDFSSNYLSNNIEALILLSLLILKFCMIKLLFVLLPKKLTSKLKWTFEKFFHYFIRELLCFTPFFIISSLCTIMDSGDDYFIGKLNTMSQILCLMVLILMPLMSLALHLIGQKRRNSMKTMVKQARYIYNCSTFVTCVIFSICLTLNSKLLFFILVTLILYWRLYYLWKNRASYSRYHLAFNLTRCITWIVYHSMFLLLYLIGVIYEDLSVTQLTSSVNMGYAIAILILFAAVVDLLDALCILIYSVFLTIRGLVSICSGKKNKAKGNVKQKLEKTKYISKIENRGEKDLYSIYPEKNEKVKNITVSSMALRTNRMKLKKTKSSKKTHKIVLNMENLNITVSGNKR